MENSEFKLSYNFRNENNSFFMIFNDIDIDFNKKQEKEFKKLIDISLPTVLKECIKAKYIIPNNKNVSITLQYGYSKALKKLHFGYTKLWCEIPFKSNAMEIMINTFIQVFTMFYFEFIQNLKVNFENKIDENFWKQFER